MCSLPKRLSGERGQIRNVVINSSRGVEPHMQVSLSLQAEAKALGGGLSMTLGFSWFLPVLRSAYTCLLGSTDEQAQGEGLAWDLNPGRR